MNKVNVLIVEDQAMPRQLFEMFINSKEEYELKASIDNASMADIYCIKYNINLVLMDVLTKGGENGLTAAAKIKKSNPDIKIIIVTSMPECSYIDKAREIGIEGFWYKEVSKEPILDLIDRVLKGEKVYPDATPSVKIGLCESKDFSAREREILRGVINGYTNREIADKLGLSDETVHSRIKNILFKTGFTSRTKLAVELISSGFIIGDYNDEPDPFTEDN